MVWYKTTDEIEEMTYKKARDQRKPDLRKQQANWP